MPPSVTIRKFDMLPLIERETYRHADNDWNITTKATISGGPARARQPMEAQGLRTQPSKLEAMATRKNAMIRFTDEKPKPKTPAPKPGRLKLSDGAKALAAFNRTAAKKRQTHAAARQRRGRE
jgi:hypothetical protein